MLIEKQDKREPFWITFRYLQNKYWTSHDSTEALEIYQRRFRSVYLCYYRHKKSIYECLYVGDPHIQVKHILRGDARDILTNDGPIQNELEVPFDSENVIWCTSGERNE